MARLPDYIRCQPTRHYNDFIVNTNLAFLAKWPERACLHGQGIPAEGLLTPQQDAIVKIATEKRKTAIVRWYRWITNAARLARSGNSNVALDLAVTMSGGDELKGTRAPQEVEVYSQCHYETRVKDAADAAIVAAGATSRGEKLSKRKEVTRIKYASENKDVRIEIKKKHQDALEKWKQGRELAKAGFMEEVTNDTKIQAFNELGPHLNRVFRYLSHKTGGLKFSCIAGGRNPSTGEIVVIDFHLGETDTGAAFSACYPGFSDVQAAYANFSKQAIAHDENMLALGKSADSDMSAKTPIDSEPSEETDREDQDQVTQDEEDKDQNDEGERNLVGDFRMEWLNDLYHIGPQEDNQMELLKDIGLDTDVQAMSRTSPSLSDEATTLSSFENFNLWTTDMEGFDNRLTVFENSFHLNLVDTSLDTSFHQPQHNSFHYASPHFDFGNFAAEQNPDYPIENFFFNASYPYGDQTSLPVEPVLSVVAPHNAPSPLASNIPTPDIPSSPVVTLLPAPPANVQCHQANNKQMNNNAVGRPTTGLTDEGQSDEAPRCTARRHVPSNRVQVLNAIGSSNARVCVTTREAKENDVLLPVTPAAKRKAKSINQSNK
ncbi:hypothetical protein EV702DRAFT_1200463 [Suillus placidus]|uniref:Uncharacterized protein n=1 Tax=Suillus placidus TaxID=48579 RepID=A0A9P7D065_9AGAM|nr:hypothetical protein EV702DRAFT_1200463 [Suillus placidus]